MFVRQADVLPAGLAAELTLLLRALPFEPTPTGAGVAWTGALQVPTTLDPQHPECLYRLLHFLDHTLPQRAAAWLGHPLVRADAGLIPVWTFRKGGYLDAAGPLPGVEAWLGLTGGSWPAAWGGHLEILSEDGRLEATLPPGFATLDLVVQQLIQVPVVTHHVEALWVRTLLVRP